MKFVVMEQGQVIADVPIKSGNTTIGRHASNDILLDHPSVSGHHAIVVSLDEQAFIRDLVSTNGTMINGTRVPKQHLRPGDRVGIGPYELYYLLETPRAADSDPAAPSNQCVTSRPALFVLSGPGNGRRIELVKQVTHLGKSGQHAGVITRTARGFELTAYTDVVLLNGKPVDSVAVPLTSGDLIDIADARLQFHFK